MAKQEVIKNEYQGSVDIFTRKYLKYFSDDFTDRASLKVFEALKTKDIGIIENCLKDVSNAASNALLLIGLSCVVIEKERLYENTEFGYSYMRYAGHLFNELNLSESTISNAKIIVETYLTYYKQLIKAGYVLAGNSSKLLYLQEALENHRNEEEVYTRIVKDTFRGFKDWAQHKNLRIAHKPEKDLRVDAEIKGNRLFINGKNILNFPKGLKSDIKEMIKNDLQKTFSIREGGNLPYIVGTYSKSEQKVLESLLAKHRAKR